ncbi:MAG: YetF domain-containing protein [Bacillota bacterium]|jgi:uncharacterized membrane protein YcaP (DUF421 family)|nr:DUF421 domain-containing protein [Clostridia bacterium]
MSQELVSLVRAILTFIILMLYARILGKQQISQLTFFDYVIGITVGSIAATMTIDLRIRFLPQLIGLTTWIGLALLLQVASLKSRKLSKIIDGEPVVIVHNGKILEDHLAKVRLKNAELLETLREKGVFNISDVEFAILESDGNVSVLKKSQRQPVTPEDLHLSTSYEGIPTELVVEGKIVRENLEELGQTEKWLLDELKKQGINNLGEVMYASLDTSGNLYVDRYEDNIKVPPDISDYPGPN